MKSSNKEISLLSLLSFGLLFACGFPSGSEKDEKRESTQRPEVKAETIGADDWGPVASPDGSLIAFYSSRNQNEAGRIFLMNTDGSNLREIPYENTGGHDIEPHWSPNGEKIAFTCQRTEGDKGEMSSSIYLMNADGSELKELYDHDAEGKGATHFGSWNEDGSGYLFFYWKPKGFEPNIFYQNLDGSNQSQLSSDNSSYRPVYSKGRIWFSSNRSGKPRHYSMNMHGEDEKDLIEELGYSFRDWAVDKQAFYFLLNDEEKGTSRIFKKNHKEKQAVELHRLNHIPAFFFSISSKQDFLLYNLMGPHNADIHKLDLHTKKTIPLLSDN